jgi:DNA modification methylase
MKQDYSKRHFNDVSEPLIVQSDYKNFLKKIKPNSIDLVLTDPPYAISRKTGFASIGDNSVKRFRVSMDFGKWDNQEINLDALADLSMKALKKSGTIIVFYDLWKITKLAEALTKAGFKQLRFIEWEKTNPVPLNSKRNYLTNSREIAVSAVKHSKPTFNSEYDNGKYLCPIHREKRIHPTQKPLKLLTELILKHSNFGDIIIDPFSGSGSTGVSALNNNRVFKGADIDIKYVKNSLKRLERECNKTKTNKYI